MTCSTNQNKAAKAATVVGISALASQAASLNGKSPQAKWAALDQAYCRQAGSRAGLRQFQVRRRKLVAANVKQFHQAIRQKRKVTLFYRTPARVKKYSLVPLDVKGGLHANSKHKRYLWGYSEKTQLPLCFRLEKVEKVALQEEAFDPAEIAKAWPGKKVKFNLPRDWGQQPMGKKGAPRPGKQKHSHRRP